MSQTEPKTAKTWQVEGAERYRAGDLPGAIEALTEASRLAPDEPAYRLNLAELARATGRLDAARAHLEDADALTGPDVGRLNHLAAAWQDLGVHDRAQRAAIRALEAGGDENSQRLFAQTLQQVQIPAARDVIVRGLREEWLAAARLASAGLAILRQRWPTDPAALADDDLATTILARMPLRDAALELRLTEVRAALLLRDPREAPALRAALAAQGRLNDYAWAESPPETAAVERLTAAMAAGTISGRELLALASYRDLGRLPGAEALLAMTWSAVVRRVVDDHIGATVAERRLIGSIPALTSIRHGVSEAVQGQYEENPYPRWSQIERQAPAPLSMVLKALLGGVEIPPVPAAPEILVAGCGTGQHALQAASYAGGKVLAVDLSRASLAYAIRKTAEAGVDNVEYAQADLLELGGLGRTFDVIECVGVLHHLADPSEGARTLAGLLRPGGLMKLGLYSAVARAPLAPAKALARQFPPTPQGIRDLRATILRAPGDDPLRAALRVGDFYTGSTCRDLLMHVQEHELTMADLQRLLDLAGLRLLGFTSQAARAGYLKAFPQDTTMTDFGRWDAFERANPQTFTGMYQLWAQKPA